ncbi:hypothetical protein [Clostridium estertheticum]|uniref:hypothetical protein n=1 Tax=Clostridium estertheticum TaxID=238834 RepID=UPI001CF3010B|nr:hypothetical protein [Clostridium estertheticum]MCB2362491.1 hypothetical protein [Clostridium estertheticum]
MVLVTENGYKILNPTKQQIANEICDLDGVDNSFAVLENDTESYIQVGGGPDDFTVEVRLYSIDGNFTHWKAEYQQTSSIDMKNILISGSFVKVQESQILNIKTVQNLFESFADSDFLAKIVKWTDMTSMFINN